ncbi:MAG: hypothetical protein J6O61_09605 [Butyrivibrio sp.]|uniref:hypothetical protein n=1 Tax=Butyrivibrio sp. TaxID=28121 RepID=UPI001B0806E3|nr:hypothetical protein [Butyrivibrio sp.]MBO6241064.1 hypothetical protein [Butyrivibrio sp.]
MKKNFVTLIVTVFFATGALVGCGSQEVVTTTTQDTAVSATTEYGTEDTSVEEATVEATVEEFAEVATEEVSADEATEEVSAETTGKSAKEQLAEATIVKEYRVYNKCAETNERYNVYLVEGNQNDTSVHVSFKALSCGDEDGFNDETFKDYEFVFSTVTSDEVAPYFEETSGDNTCIFFPNVSSDYTVEYNEDFGCFVLVSYTDDAEPEIISISFIFVEQ